MSEYRLGDHVQYMPDEEYDRLNVFQFRLLAYYIKNPVSSAVVRTISEQTHMSIGTVAKARDELLEIGYIRAVNYDPSGYVYLLKGDFDIYKIGMSVNPDVRIKSYNGLPFKVTHICSIQTENARLLEASLHKRFDSKRLNGEWFNLATDDVEYVKSLVVQA